MVPSDDALVLFADWLDVSPSALENSEHVKRVLLFPAMKPEEVGENEGAAAETPAS